MEYDTIRETALFYYEYKDAVHITLNSNKFYNGIILEVKLDFLILKDEVLGEVPVFFSEIMEIEPRLPKDGGK